MQGSTQPRRAKHCQLQGRRHLAATTRGPTHPGTPRAADHTDVDLENCKLSIGLRATVGPMLAITHRRRARRLPLQPRQHHCQRDAKGRSEIGRDGMWVHVDHRTFRVLLLFFSRGLVTILLFLAKDQVTLWAR